MVLHCEISSNLEDLAQLSTNYKWIPNSNSIRPTNEILAGKRQKLREIETKWVAFRDFVLYEVFGFRDCVSWDEKQLIMDDTNGDEMVFRPNDFPYQIEEGNHWVMWYGHKDRRRTSAQITEDIDRQIRALVADAPYDFAWYVNPKMTVPDFFHVQVFWIVWDPHSTTISTTTKSESKTASYDPMLTWV